MLQSSPVLRRLRFGAVAILLLAFALRLYHLDFRALWWDEGLSLFFAQLNYLENAQYALRLADTNPPFYRLMLGGWTALVGSSAFAARLFSVFAGIITVAAAIRMGGICGTSQIQYAKGGVVPERGVPGVAPGGRSYEEDKRFESESRSVDGVRVTLLVGVMVAASPMLIYYSREAKAYSLVAACGMVSVLLWLRLLARPARWWLWVAYGLSLAIPLGSHYITIFLIAVQAVWAMLDGGRRTADSAGYAPRSTLHASRSALLLTLSLVLAVQFPFWLLTLGGTSAAVRGETGVFEGLHGPVEFFGTHLLEFAVGPGAGGWEKGTGIAVTMLVLASLLWKEQERRKEHVSLFFPFSLLLVSLVLVPLFLGFLLNLYHEFFFPRFLLYSVPLFLLLAAAGLEATLRRSRRLRFLGLAVALLIGVTWAVHLNRYYSDPGDPAEDWRPVAAAMRGYTRADDAAIYVWGWIPGYLHAYLPADAEPEYHLGFYTPETLAPELEAIVAAHPRVWLLDYQIDQFDVRNAAGRWLGERSALIYDQWFGTAHIALFAPAPYLPWPGKGGQVVEFSNGLRLHWQPVQADLRPGDVFGLNLEWVAPPEGVGRRYTVFLHGLAADGTLAFGRDSEPVNGLRPMNGWKANETVFETRGVLLPLDLPPGEYVLEVGLYDTLTGEELRTRDSRGAVRLGSVSVR